ncbi:MAG: TonB family protein [Myxococcales bacterium]
MIMMAAASLHAGWPGDARAQAVAGAGAGDAPSGTLTKAPKLLKFVQAVYPPAKHDAGVTAQVTLSIEIDENGQVTNVEVVTGAAPDFDAAALTAARQFVFEPAEIDGAPSPVKITYRYDFTIVTQNVSLGPQVNYDGVVLERFKKRPLAHVKVRIKDLGVETLTDEDGGFAFMDVPVGTHKVELSNPRLVTVNTEETFTRGKKRTLKYLVEEREEGVDEEVVVRAPRIKKEAVETRIRTEEARRVPGTQGDTLKVVQNLPGVGRSAFGSGQLVVWGSAPKETRVVVDGVEIPALYHVGGLRSTVNSDLVRSIDLSPGSYGAEYGRGLGGLVRIDLRPLPEGTHGYVAADVIDSSAMLTTQVGHRLRLAAAGRISYLDRVLPAVSSADVGDFFPIPRYDDYQGRATLALRKDEELAVTVLGSDDHLHRAIPSSDPADTRSQNTDDSYQRLLVRYARLLPDGSSFVVTPSLGVDRGSSVSHFGDATVGVSQETWQYGLRANYRRRVGAAAILSFGVDLQGRHTSSRRNGSVNLPSREGDVVVFGQRPSGETATDEWTVDVVSAAPYVLSEITWGRLTVTPGLRFEPTLIEGNHQFPFAESTPPVGYSRLDIPRNPVGVPALAWAPNPRLSMALRVLPRLTVTAGGGIYGQPPDPEEMSPVFGNPSLNMSRAIHLSGGFSMKLRPTLVFETVGFWKRLDDLVSRNALPSPPVAQALTQDGRGRTYGVQALLRQELVRGFFGWVTYTFSRSERRDHADAQWRLFDYDQTHVLGVLGSYDFGRGWEVGARFRYSTGAPRTPVVGQFRNSLTGLYEPIFGAHNSIRIPAFYQVDARVEKAFVLKRTKLSVFLDVQNLTNRKNPEELFYDETFTRRGKITGLPTLAVAGLRMEF